MNRLADNDAAALKQALCGEVAASLPAFRPRLLLVDDEPRLLQSLHDLLADRGWELVTATTGEEAIAQLARLRFDLVLLDLRLPDISGHGVMDFIKATSIDTRVIVLSGDVEIEAAIGALKRGAYDFLRKPYPREELLNTIEHALQERSLALENQRIAAQLESSEKLYRYLVDSSPDIIYTLNHDGQFTFINERVGQLLGYAKADLIGKHYSLIVHEEDLERAHYVFHERRSGDRATRNVELRLKCVNGREDSRCFETTLMTVSFNSVGIYSTDNGPQRREYFGTYGVARDVTDRKRAEEQMSYQAYHDILTDLPNRILFQDRLGLAIIQAKRNNAELAVMFVDLDRFKIVNDSLGHINGDQLLQQVAARLKLCLRRGDTLARHGGDEFTLVLPELRDRDDAELVARKILEALRQPFALDQQEVFVSASIGIAIYPHHGDDGEQLVRHADIAMYRVKGEGKDGLRFFDPAMLEDVHQKVSLDKRLRKAIENDELEMYYQPQVDVATGKVVGAEGLMRWHHPERGLLSAGEFLPFAEESGLILPISDWMLEAACRDLREWEAAGAGKLRLALNTSPQYLDRGEFVERMQETLRRHQIAPERLEIEITENICIRNPQHAIEQLNRLHGLGVSTAIDDFGTGYSSLAYLHRFPVNTIKIDQSFVREIASEKGHYPVVLAIISIARGLGLHLVAEGVETDAQLRYLQRSGCTVMQGYRFCHPLSRTDFVGLLRTHAARLA